MAVTGTGGELVLKGLQVRWGLGLRENLFVVDRERAELLSVASRLRISGKDFRRENNDGRQRGQFLNPGRAVGDRRQYEGNLSWS